MNLQKVWHLIRTTFSEWSEDKVPRLAAALSYYTAFSLAPILVIAIAVASLWFERQSAQDLVVAQIRSLSGNQGEELINSMLSAAANTTGSNIFATVVGVVLLIFGATGVFGQLQDALNTMWEVTPKPNRGLVGILKDRFLSFTLVIGVGFLLLVSLVISAIFSALEEWSIGLFPGFELVIQIVNFVVSFLLITGLFALLFKYVPDTKIAWKDVWLGALVTSLLFTVGKILIGIYLGNGGVTDQFGAAGALVVILVWVYYSAQISFLGAEFTQVYANTYGSRIVPDENAVPLSEEARIKQGIPRKEDVEKAASRKGSVEEQAQSSRRTPAGMARPAYTPPLQDRIADPVLEARQNRSVGVFGLVAGALLTLTSGYLLGLISKSK